MVDDEHDRARRQAEARRAAHLPGCGARRRQDVRDARRGAPPAASAAPTSSPRSWRPMAARRPPICSTASRSSRRATSSTAASVSPNSTSRRCCTAAAGGAGRRTRPHQHPGQQEPEALAGRRGAARRRHHGDLDGQRPAPGKPQRRRHPDHRHRAAGEGPRRGRAGGRPDRTGRHHPGSVAAQARPWQRVCARARRRRAVQLLPPGQPDRAARTGAAVAGRPGRRGAGASTAKRTRSPTRGKPASASSSRSPAGRSRKRWCAAHPASRRNPAPS